MFRFLAGLFAALLFPVWILTAQNKVETVIQKGHTAAVKAVALSPDGKFVATGSRDKTVKLWNRFNGSELRSFFGAEMTVNSVCFSPDGKWLAGSSADGIARIWEIISGKLLYESPKESKYLTDIAFSPDGKWLVYGGYSDSAVILNVKDQEIIFKIPVNADQGTGYGISLGFSPDGKWLAVGEDDRTATLYSVPDWKKVFSFKPEEGWCGGCGTLVDFSPDSRFLLKLSNHTPLVQYDLETGKSVNTWGEVVEDPIGVGYTPEGNRFFAADREKVTVFSTSQAPQTWVFQGDEENNEAIFDSDSTMLIAHDRNQALQIRPGNSSDTVVTNRIFSGVYNETDPGGVNYNPESYWESHIAHYLKLKNPIRINPAQNGLLKGKLSTKAILWDIGSGASKTEYAGHSKAVVCFDYSADGKWLVTADAAGEAKIWEVKTGKEIRSFKGHRQPVFEVKFNDDATQLLTASWDATLILWDVESGQRDQVIDLDNSSAFSCSFTPDGLYIITGRLGKTLDMWEPDTKTLIRSFTGHTDVVSAIDFSPDGKRMLTASWDGTVRLWDMGTGLMTAKIKTRAGAVHACIFSPDGKTILTGGADRSVYLWDAQTQKQIAGLIGHQAEVTALDISPDGKMLVSASLDGVVKFWDLPTRREYFEHITLNEKDWMAKTADGYFSATPEARKAIHFVKGLDSYSADQFFDKFYRPDLLPKILKNHSTGKLDRMENVLDQGAPPEVRIAAVSSSDNEQAIVQLKVTNRGSGIKEIRFRHNGKVLPFGNHPSLQELKNGEARILTDTFSLVPGSNIFTVSAKSENQIESDASVTEIFSEQTSISSSCHIMVVGIDRYRNNTLSLNFARDDAESFAETIQSHAGGMFEKIVIHSLYDEQATTENILDTLQGLSNEIAQNDVFLFFYAGHGSMLDDHFYFIPTECTRLYEKNGSMLDAALLQEKFMEIRALKQIIILDACHAGGSVELLASRDALEEKAIAQLSRSAGIHVLASAGSEQTAKEIEALKHGIFTFVLLKGLAGEADGAPADGKVTLYELKSYLDDQVPLLNQKFTGKAQYPYTFSRGHDFPVVLKKKE